MTDQNSQFFAILTDIGRAKQANADALGTAWTFAQMGVGDANGTDPIPSGSQTKLINERRRAPLNQVKVDPTNASVIIAEQVIPESVGGWWVRELGLYDADGDLVAVANCAPTFKPLLAQGSGRTQVIRINLIVSNTANIELKIDPSVVLATREYVDTAVVEALARLDFKHSVLVATTTNIALNGIQTVDGMLLPVDARVLVKDQAQAKDNGIYVVPASGAWKRAQDADASVEVTPGLFVSVEKGTANGDSVWQLVTDAPIVLGTTPLAFEVVAGRTGVAAGTYRSLTVDKLGRVIAGTNPTTLEGSGITDGATKTALAEAISGVVAKTGATMSGSLLLSNGTEDSPRLSFSAPSSEAFFNLYNKNVRIEARSDGVVSTPLVLNLPTKSAYVFGSVIWCAANFNPDLKADKTQVNAELAKKWDLTAYPPDQYIRKGQFLPAGYNPSFGSGVAGPMSSITGTIGALQINGEIEGAPAVLALHRPGAFGTYLGLDTDNQLKLGGWSMGAYAHVIYHAGNFTPSSKISGNNCPAAGFASGDKSSPYMSHADGTIVSLQVYRPKDTALLAPTGWNKNADTGEINQWFEYTHGDFGGSAIVNVTWPFQFPNQFINASISLKFPNSAIACGVTVSYSGGTITGCTLRLEEWAGFAQTGMVLVIKAKGS